MKSFVESEATAALATSKDAPALSGVYKLVDVKSGESPSYRAKLSEEKFTYPGRKQVFRRRDAGGFYREDIIARETEQYPDTEVLLVCVMRDGKRIGQAPSLEHVRDPCPPRSLVPSRAISASACSRVVSRPLQPRTTDTLGGDPLRPRPAGRKKEQRITFFGERWT